jgi:uncharacterized protein
MDGLLEFQQNVIRPVKNDFRRFMHDRINWNHRMIGIRGPRGAGKTTMMLQRLKYDHSLSSDALYITADHNWFYNHTLLDTVADWYKQGGKRIFIDEIHKYPNWSVELKNIYDGFPEMRIVFSASSALDIYRGEADLSRRVIIYTLPGLSFREYLKFILGYDFGIVSLEEIGVNHQQLCRIISKDFRLCPHSGII